MMQVLASESVKILMDRQYDAHKFEAAKTFTDIPKWILAKGFAEATNISSESLLN